MNHLDRALSALLRPFGVPPGLGLAILGTALVVTACATGSPAQAQPSVPIWWQTKQEICDGRNNLVMRLGSGGTDTGYVVVPEAKECNNVPRGGAPR